MNDTITKTWSALGGDLLLDITFERAWRRGDAGGPALVTITCQCDPTETRLFELSRDRPIDFRIRFRSGCAIEGELQELGHILVDGFDSLGVFADLRFSAPVGPEHHFEGLVATCPCLKRHSHA